MGRPDLASFIEEMRNSPEEEDAFRNLKTSSTYRTLKAAADYLKTHDRLRPEAFPVKTILRKKKFKWDNEALFNAYMAAMKGNVRKNPRPRFIQMIQCYQFDRFSEKPSQKTFTRAVKRMLNLPEYQERLANEKKNKNSQLKPPRTSQPGEIYQADVTHLPHSVILPNGEIVSSKLFILKDTASRCPRGLLLTTQNVNHEMFGLLLKKGILTSGQCGKIIIPDYIQTDNGSEFCSHEVTQWLSNLAINRRVIPARSPKLQTYIESLNRIFKSQFVLNKEKLNEIEEMLNQNDLTQVERNYIEVRQAYAKVLSALEGNAYPIEILAEAISRYFNEFSMKKNHHLGGRSPLEYFLTESRNYQSDRSEEEIHQAIQVEKSVIFTNNYVRALNQVPYKIAQGHCAPGSKVTFKAAPEWQHKELYPPTLSALNAGNIVTLLRDDLRETDSRSTSMSFMWKKSQCNQNLCSIFESPVPIQGKIKTFKSTLTKKEKEEEKVNKKPRRKL